MSQLDKTNNSDFLDIKETSCLLGVSIPTIRNWLRLGKINYAHKIGNAFYFSKDCIEKKLSEKKSTNCTVPQYQNFLKKDRELYVNYISRTSPNHEALVIIVNNYYKTNK